MAALKRVFAFPPVTSRIPTCFQDGGTRTLLECPGFPGPGHSNKRLPDARRVRPTGTRPPLRRARFGPRVHGLPRCACTDADADADAR